MIFGAEVLDEFVFGDCSSFVDIHFDHDVLSDKLIVLGGKLLLDISLGWLQFFLWLFSGRHGGVSIRFGYNFALYLFSIYLFFTFVLLGLFPFFDVFVAGILVPGKEAFLEDSSHHLLGFLLNQILLVLEVILGQFGVLSFLLLPQLLQKHFFLRSLHILLLLLDQLIDLLGLYLLKLFVCVDVEPQFFTTLVFQWDR